MRRGGSACGGRFGERCGGGGGGGGADTVGGAVVGGTIGGNGGGGGAGGGILGVSHAMEALAVSGSEHLVPAMSSSKCAGGGQTGGAGRRRLASRCFSMTVNRDTGAPIA